MRRLAWLLLAAPVAAPVALGAQYFGGNKVQYSRFDFKILETEHFDLYYYETEHVAAIDVARMAERSYARLSKVLRHTFRERKPIILYASESDFQQTNTSPDEVSEGTGGFTDFLKHRIVIPMTGSYADVEHVLQHEMTHQFQYDIWSGGRAGAGIQTIIAVNPPLWFVEGMAEYLSIGGIDPNTAMWLRDAAQEGKIPTIHQLETDERIFPYRFGQAILTYIGQRWGDEVLGAILNASRSGGLEAAFRRNIGLDFNQLSDQWRDAVQREYLPELNSKDRASAISDEVLTKARSGGTLHVAPALSPDGSLVAYFTERSLLSIDLWLARTADGKPLHRLFNPTWSSNYETFRFINSSSSWSPDGKYLAFGGKRGATDDIIILDVPNNKEVAAIRLNLSGVTTPSWSPDGKRLVFTGYDGGMSDLFIVDRDGKNLQRLTNDKYADMNPSWSPDGKTIAFTTDRGPETDFNILQIGNYRIALYHLDTGQIELLKGMDKGKNSDPQWSPDGHELAYVSDRTGVSNIYLYELGSGNSYQITDFFTGVQGIVPLSPVLSWARQSDKLAYVYYQKGNFDVYVMTNPDSRKKAAWQATQTVAATAQASQVRSAPPPPATPPRDTTAATGSTALYRSATGLRPADSVVTPANAPPPESSMKTLIDSANMALPDTNTFTERKYKPVYTPDFAARPSIGYARSNFGQGVYGGTSVEMSDMLGDHMLLFSGYVNGRIDEAQVLAAYVNLTRRVNWAAGISQDPYFYYQGTVIQEGTPSAAEDTETEEVRAIVLRSGFITAGYPVSRFQRFEGSVHLTNVEDALLDYNQPFDPSSGLLTEDATTTKTVVQSAIFVQPSLAWVYDNSIDGYTGPFLGRRSRFEVAPAIGGWNYNQITADTRRYDHLVGPFTLATRLLYFGRTGPQATEFQTFLGYPDFIRGFTEGSYERNECANPVSAADSSSQTGCAALDQLVGTSIGVANAEIRFPLLTPGMKFLPAIFPPIEGAFFYDAGIAWNPGNTLAWTRPAGASPSNVRIPLRSYGASLRINLLGYMVLRFDYAVPQQRPGTSPYWTISFGPSY